MLEQQQKGHRAYQRHEILRAAHPAPGEALDHERGGRRRRERSADADRPGQAGTDHAHAVMAPSMNKPGMLKLRKRRTPMLSVKRDGDHRVDRAEHQAIDDLLGENGKPLDLRPAVHPSLR